ncbi:MAG: hypothetical protein II985_04035 [Alistipes sp.]|nr:hypothetical protein [Alistipes sp.]
MKKFFSNLKAIIGCTVVVAMLASSVVSCQYDDTELRGEIDNVKKELAQLRDDLQSQIDQLRALVDGQVTVKSVVTNDDGTTTVTLSDDTVFTVQPEANLDGVITIVDYDGVKYWAQYNAEGEAVLISVNGANCPVIGAEPMTRVNEETNSVEVSFDGGNSWVATGTYTGVVKAEIIYSQWQFDENDNPIPLYAQFTMADGTVVKVHVEGQAIAVWTDAAYAAPGTTTALPLYANIGEYADYMFQLPAGWSVEVVEDEYAKENFGAIGEVEIYFTAPSGEAIASGAASEGGEVKMLVTFENGSSAIAKMRVSSKAVTISADSEGVTFVNNGWDPYCAGVVWFGFVPKSEFDGDKIVAEVVACPYYSYPAQFNGMLDFYYGNELFYAYDELLSYMDGSSVELTPGAEYVIWACPGMWNANYDGMIATEFDLITLDYRHLVADFKVTNQSILDVDVEFSLQGANSYLCGISNADEFSTKYYASYANDNNYYFQWGYANTQLNYTGPISGLESFYSALPGHDYIFWIVPENESLVFTESDVLYWEFATKALETSGGAIEFTVNEADTYNDYTQMTVVLNANADKVPFVYFKYVPVFEAAAYNTDELIIEYLMDPENKAETVKNGGDTIWCTAGTWTVEGEPGDRFMLFAVAADADGKLGKPIAYEYGYKAIEYSDLVVDVEVSDLNYESVKIDVACDGAVKFLYKVMGVSSNDWKERCKASADGASTYFVLNSDSPYTVHHSDNNTAASYYGSSFENGQITYKGCAAGSTYVVCVAAMDENFKLSKVTAVEFTPTMNMGTIRYKTDAEWESSKPVVAMYEEEIVADFYTFKWYVAPKEGYTAYSIAEHVGNFTEFGIDTTSATAMIQYISSHDEVIVCEYSADGYFVDKGEYDADWNWIENWVEVPGVIGDVFYGTEGMMEIWTTWCDAEGNYFEPFMIKAEM